MMVNKKISLSVIVPCYNVELYLDRSLGCLERQWNGRSDYEIIFVNDASTDNTLDKLKRFESLYPENVIVIDKKQNGGLGEARNSGMDVAQGEWVVFFDPDDALADKAYGSLLKLVETKDIDILSFGVTSVKEREWDDRLMSTSLGHVQIEWEGPGQECILRGFSGVCWRYFFKRVLIADRRFTTRMFLEDLVFDLPIFLSDVRVASTDIVAYFYIARDTSLTGLTDPIKLNRGCDDLLSAIQFLDECKQGQVGAVVKWIEGRQLFYLGNLITRLMLSDKGHSELKRHRDAIRKLSIPKNQGKGKNHFYEFVFYHPLLLMLFRPVYRAIRSRMIQCVIRSMKR